MDLDIDLAHENTVKNTLLQRQAYVTGKVVYGFLAGFIRCYENNLPIICKFDRQFQDLADDQTLS